MSEHASTVRSALATLTFGLFVIVVAADDDVFATFAAHQHELVLSTVLTMVVGAAPRFVSSVVGAVFVAVVGAGVVVAVTSSFAPLFTAIPGGALALLMQRAQPDGPERALRMLLQSTSLVAGVVVVLVVAGAPHPLAPSFLRASLPAFVVGPGVVLVVTGFAYVAWCARFLVAGGGTADPFDPPLVRCVTGPYAQSLHPMQRGQIAAVVGLALVVGSVGAVVAAVIVVVVLVGPVRVFEAGQLARGDPGHSAEDPGAVRGSQADRTSVPPV